MQCTWVCRGTCCQAGLRRCMCSHMPRRHPCAGSPGLPCRCALTVIKQIIMLQLLTQLHPMQVKGLLMPCQQFLLPESIPVQAKARVTDVLQGVTCGQLATIVLHTVDCFSNARVSGGEHVAAQLHGGPSHSVPSTIKVYFFPCP